LIPFLLIRFGLLPVLDKQAVRRAAHFPPMIGAEKAAYWLYQLFTAAIFVCPFFLRVAADPAWLLCAGVSVYALGITACIVSVMNFARPSESGVNRSGLYRLSRNPMYLAYLIFFLGCVLLTASPVLLGLVAAFQIAAHWIIRAEERWCVEQFGEEYLQYMKKVRRYI